MNNEVENFSQDYIIAQMHVPEYTKYHKTKTWYIVAGIIVLSLLAFSFLTANFLFAIIIILIALVSLLREGKEPEIISVVITREGIEFGKTFYDFDNFKDFSIVYKPNINIKNLYFEFKNPIKPRITLPIGDLNPIELRKELLKYLKEDPEREHIPLSEQLAHIIKL